MAIVLVMEGSVRLVELKATMIERKTDRSKTAGSKLMWTVPDGESLDAFPTVPAVALTGLWRGAQDRRSSQ